MIKNNSYGLKKVVFGAVAFVAVFIMENTLVLSTSRFLSQGLIDRLPMLLVLASIASLVNFTFNVILSKRFSALGGMTTSVLLILAMAMGAFYFRDNVTTYFFISLLIARLMYAVLDTSLTNLSRSYVNARQFKSFFPLIRGIMDFAILVSSGVLFLGTWAGWSLEPLWFVVIGSVLLIVGLMIIDKLFDPVGEGNEKKADEKLSTQLRQGMDFVFRRSTLYGLFTWLFLLFGASLVLFVYVYNHSFAANLTDLELTRFLAIVNFSAVSIRGIFNLKFLKGAIYRIGLANLLLVYPWVMFLLTFMMVIWSSNLYVAAVLYIFQTFSFYSYVIVTAQSMFGLVPQKISLQVFYFVRGMIPALAALASSLIMALAINFFPNYPIIINFLLFAVMAASLAIMLRIKREYQKTLLEQAAGDDIFLKTNAVELMGESVQVEKGERLLRSILLDSSQAPILRQKALTSLVEINNPNSIRELLMILERDKNLRLRFYAMQAINRLFTLKNRRRFGYMTVTKLLMIDVFNRVYDEDLPLPIKLEVNKALPVFGFNVLLDFYKRHFSGSPDYVKASIIDAMAVYNDRGLLTLLEPYLQHESVTVRSSAIAALWMFKEKRDELMNKMIEIFAEKDDVNRMIALKLIGRLKLRHMDDYVLDLIALPNKEISVMAIITAISLGHKGALKVLTRKMNKLAMLDDTVMLDFVFRKFNLLSEKDKKLVISEIRALPTANFERMKQVFNKSDKFFDLSLAELFTN